MRVTTNSKILIVEDDPRTRDSLTQALQAKGHQVFTASSEVAIFQFMLVQPDLIILNVLMPGRDRWGNLHQIRRFSTVPIIALAASDDEGSRIESLDRGADVYVTEGWGQGELQARVAALLRRAQNSTPDRRVAQMTAG